MSERWYESAACDGMDPELFFASDSTQKKLVKEAKAICAGCPVRLECLAAATTEEDPEQYGFGAERDRNNRFGVRGGLTGRERWRLQWPEESAAIDARNNETLRSKYETLTPEQRIARRGRKVAA